MTVFGPYPAIVVDVHDGDTMTLSIDLGFDIAFKSRCRVYGINAPELSTDAGKAARDYAFILVGPGDKVTVTSHGWDKYGGRFDGTITLPDGMDFGQAMLTAGLAVPFMVR